MSLAYQLPRPADASGKRSVVARLKKRSYRDKFDPDDAYKRARFREQVIRRFELDDNVQEHLETKITAAVECEGVALFKPVVTMLNTVTPAALDWIWPNRILSGKINLVVGDPGLGKSLFSLDMAARIRRGYGFPDSHSETCKSNGVVILTNEEDADDTLVPRLLAHEADLARIADIEGITDSDGDDITVHGVDLTRDIQSIASAIEQVPDCRLVVINPISAYLGKVDSHKKPK